MTATYKKVVLKPIVDEMVGSFYLPDKRNENVMRGKVLNVGVKCNTGVKQDDIVLYHEGEGYKVDDFLVIDESHLLCICD